MSRLWLADHGDVAVADGYGSLPEHAEFARACQGAPPGTWCAGQPVATAPRSASPAISAGP